MKTSFRKRVGLIWAITAKDVLEAVKNRTILSLLVMVVFMVVLYRFLPKWESSSVLPRLAVYDQGNSSRIAVWDVQQDYDLVEFDSVETLRRYVVDKDMVILGLVLPKDFDRRMASGGEVVLDGYVVHWGAQADVEQTTTFFRTALNRDGEGKLDFTVERVRTQEDSRGYAFLGSISMLITLAMGGMFVIPHLMLEEKRTRTLDAMLVSPATIVDLLMGKVLAGGLFAMLGAILACLVNKALIHFWGVAIGACLLGAVFFVLVGLLLGSLFEHRQQLTLWGFLLINGLLAPVFLTIAKDLFHDTVGAVLQWIPSVAITKLVRLSFTEEVMVEVLGANIALVLGWSLICFVLILFVFRRRENNG